MSELVDFQGEATLDLATYNSIHLFGGYRYYHFDTFAGGRFDRPLKYSKGNYEFQAAISVTF